MNDSLSAASFKHLFPIRIADLPTIIGREDTNQFSKVVQVSSTSWKILWWSKNCRYNCQIVYDAQTYEHILSILDDPSVTYYYWQGSIAQIVEDPGIITTYEDLIPVQVECYNALLKRILDQLKIAGLVFPAIFLFHFGQIFFRVQSCFTAFTR